MVKVILYLWQLPQHLPGLCLIWMLGATKTYQPQSGIAYWFFKPKNRFGEYISGVSLGQYIVLKTKNENTVKHEYGHSIQSRRWGLFYLFVVGLPSVVNNLWDRYFHKKWAEKKRTAWYYSRWPEKQADLLGGVHRFNKEPTAHGC